MAKTNRIHAQYPLKFIPTTGHADRLAVVYMMSYGGGVISGDKFNIDMRIETRAVLLLMTQGNTKIFKDRVHQRLWLASLNDQQETTIKFSNLLPSLPAAISNLFVSQPKPAPVIEPSVQTIVSVVENEATLLVIPDPVTCFRDASFQSRQEFKLQDDTSQLVLLDWFTSGRITRGENWSFRHYSSRIDIRVGQKLVIKDAMVLEDEDYMRKEGEDTSYASRLQPYTCFATLIMISSIDSPLTKSVEGIQRKSEQMRLMPLTLKSKEDRQVLWSVSPILKGRGVLVRVAGMTTEQVRDFVKYQCLGQGLEEIVGEGMFSKVLM
ncbi:urease accessory protein UreD [Mucor mucedo]|uniref:urease accessory protein UreD n=1 Tax=Mucor mucedo TaxID=29922 RepID=UPI002220363B|nr:urease accessory protein UreD [Mucor mucedo]KAI7894672.1 urease accessory protein UreD [Mucor mucedo]